VLVDLIAVVDDAVDDVAGVQPGGLTCGFAGGALGRRGENHRELLAAHVGREEDVEGALGALVRALKISR